MAGSTPATIGIVTILTISLFYHIILLGLSFSTQLCKDIPMAENDIQLDCVLFPTTSK